MCTDITHYLVSAGTLYIQQHIFCTKLLFARICPLLIPLSPLSFIFIFCCCCHPVSLIRLHPEVVCVCVCLLVCMCACVDDCLVLFCVHVCNNRQASQRKSALVLRLP